MVQERSAAGSGLAMSVAWRANAWVWPALAAASLTVMFVLLRSPASAQDARSQARQACMADYSRYCSGTAPGGGRVRKCLSDNYAALSQACRQALDANTPK